MRSVTGAWIAGRATDRREERQHLLCDLKQLTDFAPSWNRSINRRWRYRGFSAWHAPCSSDCASRRFPMSKIQSVGSGAPVAVLEPEAQVSSPSPKAADAKSVPAVQQDPKDKISDLKMEGQVREAQVRSQLPADQAGHPWKMPGVDVKGPSLDSPSFQKGFAEFDKKMPSVDMKWPEKGDWKQTVDKDGATRRELTDADGNKFSEKINKDGMREREITAKGGDRRYEMSDSAGYVLRGGADAKGNSWTIDSNGSTTRMHQDASGQMFNEVRANGARSRQMMDTKGNRFEETLHPDGKLERESYDAAGNRQMEARDGKVWSKGFADKNGNSYSVDSNGSSMRMHHDKDGTMYAESSYLDGSSTRQIIDKQGNMVIENRDPAGNVTRRKEKLSQ